MNKNGRVDRFLDVLPDWGRTRAVPMLIVTTLVAVMQPFLRRAHPDVVPSVSSERLGAAAGVVLVGLLLVRLRETRLRLYALLEIAAALSACFIAASRLFPLRSADGSAWLTTIGAVYLVVRGLDNWKRGEDARRSTG